MTEAPQHGKPFPTDLEPVIDHSLNPHSPEADVNWTPGTCTKILGTSRCGGPVAKDAVGTWCLACEDDWVTG